MPGRVTTFAARAIATACGAGYSPVAPGTAGTLVTVPLAWALGPLALGWYLAVCAAVTLVGIGAARVADDSWGTHDSGRIVVDEVAGYLITMALVARDDWRMLAIGFVVFRACDIVKPPPARWIDRKMGGGTGVVLDDVAAGLYAMLIVYLIARYGIGGTSGETPAPQNSTGA